jgi:hypothetical protein
LITVAKGADEGGDGGSFKPDVGPGGALEHDAAHDAQEVRQRQQLAQDLRPARHAAEGEHEARQQDVGQEVEDRHLHALHLRARDGAEGVAHRQRGGDEQQHHCRQQHKAALHGHAEQQARAPKISSTCR